MTVGGCGKGQYAMEPITRKFQRDLRTRPSQQPRGKARRRKKRTAVGLNRYVFKCFQFCV